MVETVYNWFDEFESKYSRTGWCELQSIYVVAATEGVPASSFGLIFMWVNRLSSFICVNMSEWLTSNTRQEPRWFPRKFKYSKTPSKMNIKSPFKCGRRLAKQAISISPTCTLWNIFCFIDCPPSNCSFLHQIYKLHFENTNIVCEAASPSHVSHNSYKQFVSLRQLFSFSACIIVVSQTPHADGIVNGP